MFRRCSWPSQSTAQLNHCDVCGQSCWLGRSRMGHEHEKGKIGLVWGCWSWMYRISPSPFGSLICDSHWVRHCMSMEMMSNRESSLLSAATVTGYEPGTAP